MKIKSLLALSLFVSLFISAVSLQAEPGKVLRHVVMFKFKESATPAGTVLREVLKSDTAAAIILYDDPSESGPGPKGISGINPELKQSGNGVFWKFFDWIDKGTFEVSADAFTTFRVSQQLR